MSRSEEQLNDEFTLPWTSALTLTLQQVLSTALKEEHDKYQPVHTSVCDGGKRHVMSSESAPWAGLGCCPAWWHSREAKAGADADLQPEKTAHRLSRLIALLTSNTTDYEQVSSLAHEAILFCAFQCCMWRA